MATQTRSTARKRAATNSKAPQTQAQPEQTPVEVVLAQAERAVLIPVGAALVARDSVLEAAKPYTQRETAEKELTKSIRKFERRGTTARNRVRREVKRTRTRVERELRQRRNAVTRAVKRNRREAERQVKATRREVEKQVKTARTEVEKRVERAQEQIATLV